MTKAEYKNIDTYISEDHYENVKESFKELSKLIFFDKHRLNSSSSILDVGCATGALISFLHEFLECKYTGIDPSTELLEIARKKNPKQTWVEGTALSLPIEFERQFDISLCIGTLGIFDELDAKKVVEELIRCTKSGGRVYLLSQFNDYDVDVLVTHRKYSENKITGWEKGWNIFSKRTIHSWLDKKVSEVNFIDFSMPFDLPEKNDPVRTWTRQDAAGKLFLTNGLKLLVDLKFVEIII